jgi:CIC family chloride channel protein
VTPASAREPQAHEDKILLVLTVIIGAVVGLVVVAFILLTENLGSRLYPAGGSAWRRLLVPVAGSLVSGFLLYRYFPDARGSGIPQTKAALFIYNGFISFRTVLAKFGLCSISLASGIALGREGPSVQIGAGLASVMGRRLGLSPDRLKSLLPVGASAALAAAFNTPIAAVLFTLEEVMGDMHAPVLGSTVLSSATSWMVLHLILGDEPLFHVPSYQLVHPAEFGVYAVLGAIGGMVSAGFVKLLLWQRKHFLAMPRSAAWVYPTVGGVVVGLLGWFVPDVLGVGYGTVGKALNGQLVIGAMALLVVLKLVATATCYASGNAGGIFGPSLFIGAMLGGAIGGAAHNLIPDYTGSAGAYALVGMGVAFAGIVRVPLTSVIMIFEMTRDYTIIVPLMIANLVSYVISSRLQEEPIYEALQHQDGVHLPGGARTREPLLTVGDGFRPGTRTLPAEMTLRAACEVVDHSYEWWPVVDELGLRGMLAAAAFDEALRSGTGEETLASLVPAPGNRTGLNTFTFPHLHTDHPLDTAMQRMAHSGMTVMPVVSRTNVRDLLGTISRREVIDAYSMDRGGRALDAVGSAVSRRSLNLMVRSAVALGAVAMVATVLAYYYRSVRAARATAFYRAGEEFMTQDRPAEAVEQFRNALSISHSAADRQALGLALVAADRTSEAAIYLSDVLRANPNSGAANLGMARVRAGQERIDEAAAHYRRAAAGVWPQDAVDNRLKARLELVQMLEKAGRRPSAQAELLLVVADAPQDPALRKRLASMLTTLGLRREAIGALREIVQRNPGDAEAWVSLGEAEFALGEYAAAREPFRKAAELGSGEAVKHDAALAEQIVALDPLQRGLSSRERRQRSRQVLEKVTETLQACGADKVALPSKNESTEANIEMAEQIWAQRPAGCKGDAALELLMPLLHKD